MPLRTGEENYIFIFLEVNKRRDRQSIYRNINVYT